LTISFESTKDYESVPFILPVTMVPAVAPQTDFQSDRPLFGRVSAIRWYDQYYWPFALDQSGDAQAAGHYDLLLVDKNRDGDMTDEGEFVQARWSADRQLLTFDVGELHFVDKKRTDPRFTVTDMVVSVEATPDPIVQFSASMHQSMFSPLDYRLWGPHGDEMRFSADIAQMPTVNLTPEIVAAPDFDGKEIQLTLQDADVPFRIGEERRVSLVCLTGDPEKNEFVLAFNNSSFRAPVLATLLYEDQEGKSRVREFRLEDWIGEHTFAGSISVPPDAAPGEARLIVNFSETDEDDERPLHFTQVVPRIRPSGISNVGEEVPTRGWEVVIELVR
jgi:hypothetical protein